MSRSSPPEMSPPVLSPTEAARAQSSQEVPASSSSPKRHSEHLGTTLRREILKLPAIDYAEVLAMVDRARLTRQGIAGGRAGYHPPKQPQRKQPQKEPTKRGREDCDVCLKCLGDSGHVGHMKSRLHCMAQRVWDWEDVPTTPDSVYCVFCEVRPKNAKYFSDHCSSSAEHKFLVDVRARSEKRKRERDAPPRATGPEPRGIPNRGNSCFANSFLQCLASSPSVHFNAPDRLSELHALSIELGAVHVPVVVPAPGCDAPGVSRGGIEDDDDFAGLFVNVDVLPGPTPTPPVLPGVPDDVILGARDATLKESVLCSVLLELNIPKSGVGDFVAPDDLLECVPTFREFDGQRYEQHDVLEFTQHVLSSNFTDTAVGASCCASYKDVLVCEGCETDFATLFSSPLTILNFRESHIGGPPVALEELWMDSLQPERMDGLHKYECTHCTPTKGMQVASKTRTMLGFPENLLVGIQRAALNGIKRFRTPVTLPSVFTPPGAQEPYYLRSVVSHVGPTSQSGHYIAQRFFHGQWFVCNDDVSHANQHLSGDISSHYSKQSLPLILCLSRHSKNVLPHIARDPPRHLGPSSKSVGPDLDAFPVAGHHQQAAIVAIRR